MIYIMYNKYALSGKANDKALRLYKKLSKKNEVSLEELNYEGLNEKLKELNDTDKVIITGGDGTIHYFINAINPNELKCRIYFFKSGSGNDFARGHKGKLFEITDEIKNLPTFKMIEENKKFINGVGVGADALICKMVKESKHEKSYFKIAKEAIRTYKPFDMDLVVDGTIFHFTKVFTCLCQNGKYIGGGMKIAPHAKREDEYLDLYIIHNITAAKIIRLFFLVFLGKHTIVKNSVNYFKCKEVKMISKSKDLYLQAEGEVEEFKGEIEVKR